MTNDQAKEAVALLRAIHADIEAMRHPDGFGEFAGSVADDGIIIEWANLSILSCKIEEYLDSLYKHDEPIEDE